MLDKFFRSVRCFIELVCDMFMYYFGFGFIFLPASWLFAYQLGAKESVVMFFAYSTYLCYLIFIIFFIKLEIKNIHKRTLLNKQTLEKLKQDFILSCNDINGFNEKFKQDYQTILNAFSPFFKTRIKWIRQHKNNHFAWSKEPNVELQCYYRDPYTPNLASEIAFQYKKQLSRMYLTPLHHEEPNSFEYFLKQFMKKEYKKIVKELYNVDATIEL